MTLRDRGGLVRGGPLGWWLAATAAVVVTLWAPIRAAGQQVVIEGPLEPPAGAVIDSILQRDDYLLLDRDTLLGTGVSITTDVLVVAARVTLEGHIAGSVGVIEGDFFVRPRARVDGDIAVLGFGGAYVSGLAQVGRVVHLDPRIGVRLERDARPIRVVLVGPPGPGTLRLPDLYGFRPPMHDRVNGLSVPWTAEAHLGGRDTARLVVSATARYRVSRGEADGTAEVRFRPTARSLFAVRGGRDVHTAETWIRGDIANTIESIVGASDVRNYFESDAISLTVARVPPPPLIPGEGFIAPFLTGRLSRDRSLPGRRPWSLMGSRADWRPNPPIDDGVLASLTGGLGFGWRGTASRLTGAAAVEWAPGTTGDFEFAQASAFASFTTRGVWTDWFRVQGYLLHPLGRHEAPLQRWSFVGGNGTLPTLATGELRGDRVVFVNSVYLAPVPRVWIPFAGEPLIRLEHAIGTAWRTGDPRPALEQNLGFGLQLAVINGMLWVNPAERPREFVASFGVDLPASRTRPTF